MPARLLSIGVDVDYQRAITYAYLNSTRSVISRISVRNLGDESTVGMRIRPRVTVEAPFDEPIAAVWDGPPAELPRPAARDAPTVEWSRVRPRFNARVLGRIPERTNASLKVEILDDDDQVVWSGFEGVTLLAASEWLHDPAYYDSLAAFVLPNSSVLDPVLDRARNALGAVTGDSKTQGYQLERINIRRSVERAHAMAAATYEALREEGLNYSDPPPAFERFVQRVRTPQVVFRERAATCLDSSVLYAAALAKCGLDPVIFLVRGHAFAGYATRSDALAGRPSVIENRSEVQFLVEHGLVQPVETTTLCGGIEDSTPFGMALEACSEYFRADIDAFDAMIVVQTAWQTGIAPPPRLSDSILDDVDEEHPAHLIDRHAIVDDDFEPALDDFEFEADAASAGERPPPRVRQWMNSLLDLSSRNSLLKMAVREKSGKETARFMEFVVPPESLGKIDDLLFTPRSRLTIGTPGDLPAKYKSSGLTPGEFAAEFPSLRSQLMYPPYTRINELSASVRTLIAQREAGTLPAGLPADITDLDIERLLHAGFTDECAAALRTRATKIQALADESMLSTGSNALHLALGVLSWSETSAGRGGPARAVEYAAPIFLYPVVLEGGKGAPLTIRLDSSGSISPNYCLQEKLRRPPYNLDLPELSTPLGDTLGIDIDQMLTSIGNKLRTAKMSNFAVQRRCILGVFDYSTFRLWRDLHDNWATMRDTSAVVRHLMYTPGRPMDAKPMSEDSTRLEPYCAIEADDSQVEAIRWALDGRSFRLEGPPGTGKTQTITNLIASCLAHGKKILFVAEKQTALQQVKKRLHSIGLGDYCLELHAKGDSDTRLRKTIAEQVSGAMDATAEERNAEWIDLSSRAEAEKRTLDAYAAALHELNSAELSLWKARESAAVLGTGPSVRVPRRFLEDYSTLWPRFRAIEVELPNIIEVAGGLEGNPWRLVDRLDFESLDRAALSDALVGLRTAVDECASLDREWRAAREELEPSSIETLLMAAGLSEVGFAISPAAFGRGAGRSAWVESAGAKRTEVVGLIGRLAPHLDLLGSGFAARDDLDRIEGQLADTVGAKWPTASRKQRQFADLIGGPRAQADPSAVVTAATAAVPLIRSLQTLVRRAADELMVDIPSSSLGDLSGLVDRLDRTVAVVVRLAAGDLSDSTRDGAQRLAASGTGNQIANRIVGQFVDRWNQVVQILGIEPAGITRWRGERPLLEALSSSFDQWIADRGDHHRYLRLQRWSAVAAAANRLSDCGLGHVRDAVLDGSIDPIQLGEMVQRGVFETTIEERLEAGNIDNFDAGSHDRRIERFERTLTDLRELMKERIPGLIVSRRQEARQQRSSAAGEVAGLLRELKPLRGEKTPIRALLERHAGALVDTMPCFMMSPDSVATLLPFGSVTFDLVIFDEASQVKTAHAIGALGRGMANIVVGDSKQMPPTSAFSANKGRFEEADEDDDGDDALGLAGGQQMAEGAEEIETGVEEEPTAETLVGAAARDVESILQEFEAAYVPHLQLLCHYRSKDELLIAFSNAEIYEQPMLTFPSTAGLASTALEFRRVDGQFFRKHVRSENPLVSGQRIDLHRTNPVEAQAVVEEVLSRLRDPQRQARRASGRQFGHESIIVVTFNKPQQELITLLLAAADDPDDPVVARALSEEKDDETGVLIADPQLKIRNLETVQGDEAETVIFSVAFSKLAADERRTASARVPLNFGPVTQEGGHRRLNVAVTRAQRKMVVFCSFDPGDMDVKSTSSEGARLVQKFLMLAKNGPRHSGDIGLGGSRSRHVEEIARAIAALGYRTQTQMGLSALRVDIAVGLPDSDRWTLAVMVDGPAWASRGSAFQREILPKNVLHSLGWHHVARVWLPSWIDEREAVLEKLQSALANLAAGLNIDGEAGRDDASRPDEQAASGSPDPTPLLEPSPVTSGGVARPVGDLGMAPAAVSADDSDLDSIAPPPGFGAGVDDTIDEYPDVPDLGRERVVVPSRGSDKGDSLSQRATTRRQFEPFVPNSRGPAGILDLMASGKAKQLVLQAIEDVIAVEAPVVAARLGRLVANCFELNTVKSARIDAIVSLVQRARVESTPLGKVIWQSPEQRASWDCYRTSDERALRTFTEVPAPELCIALVDAVANGHHTREDAVREVALAYGIRRMGAKVRDRLGQVTALSLRRGLLLADGDSLKLPN